MEETGWASAAEAADALHFTPAHVRRLIDSGVLEGRKALRGRREVWEVSRASLARQLEASPARPSLAPVPETHAETAVEAALRRENAELRREADRLRAQLAAAYRAHRALLDSVELDALARRP